MQNWMTPLHVAAREGWVDAAQALLDAGADVSGRTLLVRVLTCTRHAVALALGPPVAALGQCPLALLEPRS